MTDSDSEHYPVDRPKLPTATPWWERLGAWASNRRRQLGVIAGGLALLITAGAATTNGYGLFDSSPKRKASHNIAIGTTTTTTEAIFELPPSTTTSEEITTTTTTAAPETTTTKAAPPRTVVSVKVVTDPNTAKQLKELQDKQAADDAAKRKAQQDQQNAENAQKQAEAEKLAKRKQQCADLAKVALPEAPQNDKQDFVWDLSDTGDGVDTYSKDEAADKYRYDPNPPDTSQYRSHKNPSYDTFDTDCADVGGHKYIVVDWLADNHRSPYMPAAPSSSSTTTSLN